MNIRNQIKRQHVKESIQAEFNATLEQRINRYIEINHQGIIGGHYFANASSECINLYRDGYFLTTVMVSQSVNEGIVKFIAERNNIPKKEHSELIKEFLDKNIISVECAEASKHIWESFRNDVHHMNPKVAEIPFKELSQRNLNDLAKIEKEIFGADFNKGALVPHHPQYWDLNQDGTIPVFLRLE